jgi:hypothetical protein
MSVQTKLYNRSELLLFMCRKCFSYTRIESIVTFKYSKYCEDKFTSFLSYTELLFDWSYFKSIKSYDFFQTKPIFKLRH